MKSLVLRASAIVGAAGVALLGLAGSAMAAAPTFTTPNFDDAAGNVMSGVSGVLPDALIVGAFLLAIAAGWRLLKHFSH